MVAAAIFLIGEAGMKIWSSEAVQTRFVYMWPYQNEILEYSSKNKIDPFLVAAVIKNESGFDTEAVSHAGAVGLMQIMPETGEWIAAQMGLDHFDMELCAGQNITCGLAAGIWANWNMNFSATGC